MNVGELIKADFRNVLRDPTLLMAAVAPFLILLVILLGLPFITNYVINRWGFDIAPYHRIIKVFFVLIMSMIYGMISAFIILDDNDESIISFIKVTPFSLKGYLIYRAGFAFVSSIFAVSLLTLVFFFMKEFSLFDSLYLILLVPLESIIMSLFIVSFAKSKVEGLAISKMVGVIPFSGVGAYFISDSLEYLLAFFPPFWIIKTIEATNPVSILTFIIISITIHLLYISLLIKRFNNRIEN